MLIYIVLFAITLLISFIYDRLENKNKYKWIFFILLFIIIGSVQAFRVNVGTDYNGTYKGLFNHFLYSAENDLNIESGYYFIYRVIHQLNFDLQSFFIITGYLNTFLFLKAIFDNSKNIKFSIFLYFFGTAFFFSMNAIRQATSIGLFLISIKYLKNNNIKKYMITNVIGCLFHSSSLFYLPIYFIRNKKIDIKKALLIIIFSFLLTSIIGNIFHDIIMNTKFSKYYSVDSSEFATGKINLQSIINLIILFVSYIFYKYLNNNKEYNLYCNIMIICAICSIFGMYIPAGFRLVSSFKYTDILIIPNIMYLMIQYLKANSYNEKKMTFIILFIIMIYISYFIYSGIYLNYNDCIPYKSIFS